MGEQVDKIVPECQTFAGGPRDRLHQEERKRKVQETEAETEKF